MKSATRTAAIAAALFAVALVPAAASAGVDYSKNAAGGDYAPAVVNASDPAPTGDAGFEWADAAIGAAVALGFIAIAMLVRPGFGRPGRELSGSAGPASG